MTKSSDTKTTLYCSFCGKSQHEVRKLIAGPTVFICDECVELCTDIIREESKTNIVKSRDGVPVPRDIKNVLDDYVITLSAFCLSLFTTTISGLRMVRVVQRLSWPSRTSCLLAQRAAVKLCWQ